MKLVQILLSLLVVLTTTEADGRHDNSVKLKAELETIFRRVLDAANRGDLGDFVKYHTEDCVLNFQDAQPVQCTGDLALLTINSISPLVLEGIDFIKVLSDNKVYSPISVNSVDSTGKTIVRMRIIILWLMEDKWLIERIFVNYKEIPPKAQAQADIEAQLAVLYEGFTQDDVNKIFTVYLEDARWLLHGFENIKGKTAVRSVLEGLFPVLKIFELGKILSFELFGDDVAYTTSYLNHIDENEGLFGRFRDDLLWVKVDGVWLIQIDAFNEVPLDCTKV